MTQPEFYDLHCSLGEGRSVTDPVTNWVLIAGVEIDRDLANMLQAGRYPNKYLGDFLHELMHHWCFLSPVGTALSLLQMRARRNALLHIIETSEYPNNDLDKIAEDTLRYEAAIGVLRPLAEGLALFADFDAFPGNSEIMSIIMSLTLVHFTDWRGTSNSNTRLNLLRERLFSHRLSNFTRERKANLYVQPLSAEGGGYLLGYLFVKNLMYLLQNQSNSHKLFDSDFYMTFLRSFIYEDYGLVAMLLDKEKQLNPFTMDKQEPVQATFQYLVDRFTQLQKFTTDKILAQFENAVLTNTVRERV